MTERGEGERLSRSQYHLRRSRGMQHKMIGRSLSKFYQTVCDEALPQDFIELLAKLDARAL